MGIAPLGSTGGLSSLFSQDAIPRGGLSKLFGKPEPSSSSSLSSLFRQDAVPSTGQLSSGTQDLVGGAGDGATALLKILAGQGLSAQNQALASLFATDPTGGALSGGGVLDALSQTDPTGGLLGGGGTLGGLFGIGGQSPAYSDAASNILGAIFQPQNDLIGDVLNAIG